VISNFYSGYVEAFESEFAVPIPTFQLPTKGSAAGIVLLN
jgi:hypothetical protein